MLKIAFSRTVHLYISHGCKASVPTAISVTYPYLTHHEKGAHTKYWLLLCFQSAVTVTQVKGVQISGLELLLSYGSIM
jgi:hypothetical protein